MELFNKKCVFKKVQKQMDNINIERTEYETLRIINNALAFEIYMQQFFPDTYKRMISWMNEHERTAELHEKFNKPLKYYDEGWF